jgi:hypothetical protein
MMAGFSKSPVRCDVFAMARDKYTVPDAWLMLRLSGEPKSTCRSPFREDKSPSFSIHSDGKAWTDHATGDGGDVIEFIRHAIAGDHREVRTWLMERIGIDYLDHGPVRQCTRPPITQKPSKAIAWPAEILEGTEATWEAFAKHRGVTYPATWSAVKAGILRFTIIDGVKCYIITDDVGRAAEIRRMDGKPFGTAKAYPLAGVDKRWMPGAAMLRTAPPETSVLVMEGATDLLTAIDLYSRYRRKAGGRQSWQPITLLGAGCKVIDDVCADWIRGRHVRLVPDADDAGDRMRDHWTELFRNLGCPVDHVILPRGTDLTDNRETIEPTHLFSL